MEPMTFPKGFTEANYQYYDGFIDGTYFELTRIIHHRNSFLPTIRGKIEPTGNGATIDIKMRISPFVIGFMVLWMGMVFLGFVALVVNSILNGIFDPSILVPLGMFLFGYGLTIGAFSIESSKSKDFLSNLFEAEELS